MTATAIVKTQNGAGSSLTIEPVQITTDDGARLAATLFAPAATPKLAVVIHGATGTPQTYYAKFARWLADHHGATVLTYDYRDSSASALDHPRRSKARLSDWGIADQSAALDALIERHPDLPIWVIGHSLGGMFLTFHAQAEKISRAIVIGAGEGYWLAHPWSYMPQILVFWWLIPLVTLLFGFMPGRVLGLGADLPGGVYWQWRRWCLSKRFYRIDFGRHMPHPELTRLACPIRIVSVSDDQLMPPSQTERLADFYPAAQIERRLFSPADTGGRPIGHLGAFREQNAVLWSRLVEACSLSKPEPISDAA